MTKILITVLLLTIIGTYANAQSAKLNLEERLYPGTVTTTDGKEIKGYVLNLGRVANQSKCIFYLDANDRHTKTVYKPNDLIGYTIENFKYKSINYTGNISFLKSSAHNFVMIIKPGPVTELMYYLEGEQLVLQKGDEEPVSNASMLMSFRKSALKLFGDDTDMAAKIEKKQNGYGLLNIDQMVDEYNTWAATKK